MLYVEYLRILLNSLGSVEDGNYSQTIIPYNEPPIDEQVSIAGKKTMHEHRSANAHIGKGNRGIFIFRIRISVKYHPKGNLQVVTQPFFSFRIRH